MFSAPGTTARAHADRAHHASRWRAWIERAGAPTATARQPVWSSREAWLGALGQWAQSRALAALCTAERVSITATTLLAIAAVMAEHADHGTGRHVAITRATIAARVGCAERTVTAAWRLLRASGWAVEAQRGHGSPGTPSIGRRPSVYHLIPRRQAPTPEPVELRGLEPLASTQSARSATNSTTAPVDNPTDCHLPPLGGVCSLPPVGSNSPSAQARKKNSISSVKSRRRRAEPRPLPVQRLAAELVARCHGLHRGHIGAICDALTGAGVDPAVWTARAVVDALDADMRRTGWSWPDTITAPAAFLATRLRRLDWRPQTPPPPVVQAAPASPPAAMTPPTGKGRADAFAALAAARRRALHRRTAAAAANTARLDAQVAAARAARHLLNAAPRHTPNSAAARHTVERNNTTPGGDK